MGHIGSALSIADIMAALYGGVLRIDTPQDPERDRFILSKGHAALALYAALYLKGFITGEELHSFKVDGSWLGTHPEHRMTGIDFSTGSLGHGVTYAAGAALAARLQNSSRRVFALLSDAECNEGSVWEAAMFAAHRRLANLVLIIDLNGQQAFGYTKDVLDLEPLEERWRVFGWHAVQANGHDVAHLQQVFNNLNFAEGKPHVILAKTTFGKGVSFMGNMIKWHYWPMDAVEYAQALREVEAAS